jgi:hypothetical protein
MTHPCWILFFWALKGTGSSIYRVGQSRIYTPYMTVCMVISLRKIPYIKVLAGPRLSSRSKHPKKKACIKKCDVHGFSVIPRIPYCFCFGLCTWWPCLLDQDRGKKASRCSHWASHRYDTVRYLFCKLKFQCNLWELITGSRNFKSPGNLQAATSDLSKHHLLFAAPTWSWSPPSTSQSRLRKSASKSPNRGRVASFPQIFSFLFYV